MIVSITLQTGSKRQISFPQLRAASISVENWMETTASVFFWVCVRETLQPGEHHKNGGETNLFLSVQRKETNVLKNSKNRRLCAKLTPAAYRASEVCSEVWNMDLHADVHVSSDQDPARPCVFCTSLLLSYVLAAAKVPCSSDRMHILVLISSLVCRKDRKASAVLIL